MKHTGTRVLYHTPPVCATVPAMPSPNFRRMMWLGSSLSVPLHGWVGKCGKAKEMGDRPGAQPSPARSTRHACNAELVPLQPNAALLLHLQLLLLLLKQTRR